MNAAGTGRSALPTVRPNYMLIAQNWTEALSLDNFW